MKTVLCFIIFVCLGMIGIIVGSVIGNVLNIIIIKFENICDEIRKFFHKFY